MDDVDYGDTNESNGLQCEMSSPDTKAIPKYFRRFLTFASVVLGILVSICYLGRFDLCTAVTVFPVWIWIFLGIPLAAIGSWRVDRRMFFLVMGMWLVCVVCLADEPASLFRGTMRFIASNQLSVADAGTKIRVVTLNCHASTKAAREVLELKPDIVLLQESPAMRDLQSLAIDLFGNHHCIISGIDAAILASGEALWSNTAKDGRSELTQVRVQLASGVELAVTNIHLLASTFRFDFWSPNCWKRYARNRRRRRDDLQKILLKVDEMSTDLPLILGGDFNAPPGDAVFRLLKPRFYDVFSQAGVGWGNSFENDWPVLRIDQIWASDNLRAMSAFVQKTQHSDHRIVICDLVLDHNGKLKSHDSQQ